jgi:hypothetical protein
VKKRWARYGNTLTKGMFGLESLESITVMVEVEKTSSWTVRACEFYGSHFVSLVIFRIKRAVMSGGMSTGYGVCRQPELLMFGLDRSSAIPAHVKSRG